MYEVYTQSGLSWSMASLGTGASSYKRVVQGESNFLHFFCKLLELLRVYSTNGVSYHTSKKFILGLLNTKIIFLCVYHRSSKF